MNVPYTALARRFRPQTFSEVVGQGRIATTLRNAILEGRVAHAYLFTGARGVGKTSMARIFAKALNCPNAVDAVPCNDCEICRSIAAGQDVDVSEIDGASNRGIDDIRALRANVNVRSMRSKFKVYIVDEVHMLTKEAFNALLKTLEEPPPGVKFIFCTTEPNKVPDTILSRCQRFDFGTISTQEIRGRLGQLAEAEGFDVDDEALELVARRAAGSMRDSQSLFDQLLAFGSQTISADDVHRLLGTAPDDRLVDLMDVLIQQQPGEALIQLEAALSQGVQLDPFWDQLIAYARDLMITATGAVQLPLMSVSERQRSRLVEQAQAWKLPLILAAMEILSETRQKMQRSTFGRALAELGLVQISRLRELEQLEVLIAELKAGGGTETGPSLPMQARTLPARQVSTASESPQKKNSELAIAPSRGSPTAPRSVEELQVAEESLRTAELTSAGDGEGENGEKAPPEIEWDAHCGKKILEALQSRFVDIVGSHLKNVVSTAITGPNQLEFSFPARYDMCRRACERPEVLNDIESAASELTQRRVRIKFRIVEQGPPEKSVKAPPLAPRQRTVEEPDDPLVCEVGRVFGVEAWRLLELGPIARPSVDDHDSDGMAIDALQEDET